jgi:hypothetical protein
MHLHLATTIFLVALLCSLVSRVMGGVSGPSRPLLDTVRLKVLVYAPARVSTEILWEVLTRAQSPGSVQLCVMVECAEARDQWTVDPQLLRHQVRVEHVVRTEAVSPGKALARLMDRFVMGDEECVVFLHPQARLLQGWDRTLTRLMDDLPPHCVLSVPTADRDGLPRFPTLRTRSTGALARDTSRSFPEGGSCGTVPSVCWCAELVALRPSTPREWMRAPTFVPAPDAKEAHVVPTVALLEPDETLEDAVLDEDEGREGRPLRPCEAIGLTPRATDHERIRKFGSVLEARLRARPSE